MNFEKTEMSNTINLHHVALEPGSQQQQHRHHQSQNLKKPPKDSNICNECGAVCHKPSVLKKHIRKHTNERPYPCKLCDRSFKTKSNLTKHEKSKGHTKLLTTTTQPHLSSEDVGIEHTTHHHQHSPDKGSTSQRADVMLQAMAEYLANNTTGMLESDAITDHNARTSTCTGTNSSLGSESEVTSSYANQEEDTYEQYHYGVHGHHHLDHDYHSSLPRDDEYDDDVDGEDNNDDNDDDVDREDNENEHNDYNESGDGHNMRLIKQEVHLPSDPLDSQGNKCPGTLTIQTSTGPISVEVEINMETVRSLQTRLSKVPEDMSTLLGAVDRSISPSSSTTHMSSPIINTNSNITNLSNTTKTCRNDAELHAAESILHMANQRPSPHLSSRVASPPLTLNSNTGNQFISSGVRTNIYSAIPAVTNIQNLLSISELKEDNSSSNSVNSHQKRYPAVRPTTLINKSDDSSGPHKRIKYIAINSTNSNNLSNTINTSSSSHGVSNPISIKRKIESSTNWTTISSKFSAKSPLLNSSVFTNSSQLLNPSKPLSPLLPSNLGSAITPISLANIAMTTVPSISSSASSTPTTNMQLQQSADSIRPNNTKKQVIENLMKKMQKKHPPVSESPQHIKRLTPTSTSPNTTPCILPTTSSSLLPPPLLSHNTPLLVTLSPSDIPSSQSTLSKVITNTASLHNQLAKHQTRSSTTPPFVIKTSATNLNHVPVVSICSITNVCQASSHESTNSQEASNADAAMSEDGGRSIHSEDDRSPQLKIDEGLNSSDEKNINTGSGHSPGRFDEDHNSETLNNKSNQPKIEESVNNSHLTCCNKPDKKDDDDDDDEEIDVVNTDSGDEQLKSNARNDAFLALTKTKSNGGIHSKRKLSREFANERAKKFKEEKHNVPLYNPNINAKDLLQDIPLNLSANRQPTIAVPLGHQNLANQNDLHSSNSNNPDNGTSILKTICDHLTGNMSKSTDNSSTHNNVTSDTNRLLHTTSASESPVVATLSANSSTHTSASPRNLLTGNTISRSSQPPLDSYQLMYLQPEDKRQCGHCSQFVDPGHYKMHMQRHKYTEKEVSEHVLQSPGVKSQHYMRIHASSVSPRPDSTTATTSNSTNSSSTPNITSAMFIPSFNRPRNHKCSVCGVAFRVSGHLRKHYNSKSHLQGLVTLGLVSRQLYSQIEHQRVPPVEIVDQTTGNINPEALRRHITNWTPSSEDDRTDDTVPPTEDVSPQQRHVKLLHTPRH